MDGFDSDTYTAAVERLRPQLSSWARGKITASQVEDFTAEVFATAWSRRHTYRVDLGELDPWIWGIAKIELTRSQRAGARAHGLFDRAYAERDEPSAEEAAVPAVVATGAIAGVALAIAALGDTDLAIITATVASYLGVTRGGAAIPLDAAARVRLFRVRQRLRRELDQ